MRHSWHYGGFLRIVIYLRGRERRQIRERSTIVSSGCGSWITTWVTNLNEVEHFISSKQLNGLHIPVRDNFLVFYLTSIFQFSIHRSTSETRLPNTYRDCLSEKRDLLLKNNLIKLNFPCIFVKIHLRTKEGGAVRQPGFSISRAFEVHNFSRVLVSRTLFRHR